jgi:hypothetical protein
MLMTGFRASIVIGQQLGTTLLGKKRETNQRNTPGSHWVKPHGEQCIRLETSSIWDHSPLRWLHAQRMLRARDLPEATT